MPRTLQEIQNLLEGFSPSKGALESKTREELEEILNTDLYATIVALKFMQAFDKTNGGEINDALKQASSLLDGIQILIKLKTPSSVPAPAKAEATPGQSRLAEFLLSDEAHRDFGKPGSDITQSEDILTPSLRMKFTEWQSQMSPEEAILKLFKEIEFRMRLKAFVYQAIYDFLEEKTDTGKIPPGTYPVLSRTGVSPYSLEAFLNSFPKSEREFAHELREQFMSSVIHHNRAALFLANQGSKTEFGPITDKFASGDENTDFTKGGEFLSPSFTGDFLEISRVYFPATYAAAFPTYELYSAFLVARGLTGISEANWKELFETKDKDGNPIDKHPYHSPKPEQDDGYLVDRKNQYLDSFPDLKPHIADLVKLPPTITEDSILKHLEDKNKKIGETYQESPTFAGLIADIASIMVASSDAGTREEQITAVINAVNMLNTSKANLGVKRCRSFLFWTGDVSKLDIEGKAGTGLATVINSGPMGKSSNKNFVSPELEEDNYYGLHAIGYNVASASQSRPTKPEALLYRQPFFLLPRSWWQNDGTKEKDKNGNLIPIFVRLADSSYDYGKINWKTQLADDRDYSLYVKFGLDRFGKVADTSVATNLLPDYREIIKDITLTSPYPLMEKGVGSWQNILDKHTKIVLDKMDHGQRWWQYDVQYQARFYPRNSAHWVFRQFRMEPEYYYTQDANGEWRWFPNLNTKSVFDSSKDNSFGDYDAKLKKYCEEYRDAPDKSTQTTMFFAINWRIALTDITASLRFYVPQRPDMLESSLFTSTPARLGTYLSTGLSVLTDIERKAIVDYFTKGIKTITSGAQQPREDFVPPNFAEQDIKWAIEQSGILQPSVLEFDDYNRRKVIKGSSLSEHPTFKKYLKK